MPKTAKKKDLRDGLPGRTTPVTSDKLERDEDTRAARGPAIVTPEPGKNIPSGQTTKG